MLNNSVSNIDMFGTTFNFSTFGSRKFHTILGLLLSLCCYGIIASFIFVFGKDMIDKTNPKIITEAIRPSQYYRIFPNVNRFTLAWRIMDQNTFTFDMNKKLYPRIEYFRFIKNQTTKVLDRVFQLQLDAEACSESNVFDPLFKQGLMLSDWNCVDFKKYNLTVGGNLDGDFVDYFRIRIYACKGNNYKNSCTSLDDLKKMFITENKLYFQMLYPDFFFQPQNLMDPLKYQYSNLVTQLSQSLIKKDRAFFKNIYLEDDQNLISQEWTYSNQTAFSYIDRDYGVKLDSDYLDQTLSSELYTLTFYFDKNGEKFIRSYMKLSDLAATVGGFMQIILIAGKLLSFQFNSYQRNITLFNQIFDFQEADPLVFSKKLSQKLGKKFSKNIFDNPNFGEGEKEEILKLNLPKPRETARSKFGGDDAPPNKSLTNRSKNNVNTMFEMVSTENNRLNHSVNENMDVNNNFNDDDSANLSRNMNNSLKMKNRTLKSSSSYTIIGKSKEDLLKHRSMKGRKTELPKYDDKREAEIMQRINEEKKKREESWKEFKLGFFLFIRKALCRNTVAKEDEKNVNIYDFAVDYVQEKLDIIYYMNLQTSFEKFQLFNFNEIQKFAFRNMRKPNLLTKDDLDLFDIEFDSNKTKKERLVQKEKEYSEQHLKIVKYFVSKLKEDGFDDLDEKLFDLLEQKFKKIIITEADTPS